MKVSIKKHLLFTSVFLTIFGFLTGLCFAETHSIMTSDQEESSQPQNVTPIKANVAVAIGANGRIILPDPDAHFGSATDETPVLNPTQTLLQEKAQAEAMSQAVLPSAPAEDLPMPDAPLPMEDTLLPIEESVAPVVEQNESAQTQTESTPVQVTVQKPILPSPSEEVASETPKTDSPNVANPVTPNATATSTPEVATKAVATPSASCDTCGCDACDKCGLMPWLGYSHGKSFTQSLREDVKWSGYINAGYDSNFSGDRSNGLVDCWNSTDPALNGLYISAIKKAYTNGCGTDWGFGVDFMFGEDARLMQSTRGFDDSWDTGSMYNTRTGLYDRNSYGFAMPQLYAEVAVNNWTVKMGHFYGLLGYESVKASDRFFYTKGLGFQVTPITQTGILASYNGFQNLDVTLGWVNGWGNGFDNSEYCEGMITGAFTYRVNPFTSLKYAFQSGTADMNNVLGFTGPYCDYPMKGVGAMHNVNLIVQLNQCLEAVTTFHYGDYGVATNTDNGDRFMVFGEHLYYTVNCCWKVGMRLEWLKNTAYTTRGNFNDEITSMAVGANWHPAGVQCLTVRPELRYDRAIGDNHNTILNGRLDQITMGFDVMYKF